MKLALGITLGALVGGFATLALVHAGMAALPVAHAQTVAADNGANSTPIVGIGGATQNMNDLCWILFKEKGKDRAGGEHDRYVLCLYRAVNNGKASAFDLADVREVTYDPKAVQLASAEHNPKLTPQAMREAYEKAKKEEEARRKKEEEENRKKNGGN